MGINIDKLVKSQKTPVFVIPAKAEIQETQPLMDSRSPIRSRTSFAGMTALETFYETIKLRLFAKSSNIKCQLSQFRNS